MRALGLTRIALIHQANARTRSLLSGKTSNAATFLALRNAVSDGAVLNITTDIAFSSEISIKAISVRFNSSVSAVLSTGGACRILSVSAGGRLLVNGLVLTGGWSLSGGAISVSGATLPLTACKMSSNTAAHNGGGVYLTNSSGTFRDFAFMSNHATYDGGGGFITDSTNGLFIGCLFSSNSVGDDGGGLYVGTGTRRMGSFGVRLSRTLSMMTEEELLSVTTLPALSVNVCFIRITRTTMEVRVSSWMPRAAGPLHHHAPTASHRRWRIRSITQLPNHSPHLYRAHL
jgi:hypothetical protein